MNTESNRKCSLALSDEGAPSADGGREIPARNRASPSGKNQRFLPSPFAKGGFGAV